MHHEVENRFNLVGSDHKKEKARDKPLPSGKEEPRNPKESKVEKMPPHVLNTLTHPKPNVTSRTHSSQPLRAEVLFVG